MGDKTIRKLDHWFDDGADEGGFFVKSADQWLDILDDITPLPLPDEYDVPWGLSQILRRLLEFLPPTFNKDPVPKLAFEIKHESGTMTYRSEDAFLFTRLGDSFVEDLHIDLRDKTVQQVVDEINAADGYSARVITSGDWSTWRVIETTRDDTDGKLYLFQSPLWALFKTYAVEVQKIWASVRETLRHMVLIGSTGMVEDFWGEFFDIKRKIEEKDIPYGMRVIWTIKLPKSNNVGMELIIKDILGFDTTVVDLGDATAEGLMYMDDPTTPVHDIRFCVFARDFDFRVEPCTFGIILKDRTLYEISPAEMYNLKELVYAIKQTGVRPKLIWKGEARVMYMDDPATPVNDTKYPLYMDYEYLNGYCSLFLTPNTE